MSCLLFSFWSRLSEPLGYQKEKGHCSLPIKVSGRSIGLDGASKVSPAHASFVYPASHASRDRTGNAASFECNERILLCVADQHFTEDIKTWFLRAVSLGFSISDSNAGISEPSRRRARSHCCVRACVYRPACPQWLPWLPGVGGPTSQFWGARSFIFRGQKCHQKCQKTHLQSFIVYASTVRGTLSTRS